MDIRELTEGTERQEAVPLLRQLWNDAPSDDVLEWTADDDYHLFGGCIEGEVVGVAGVLTTHVLHHARIAWLSDLVVDESQRGNGYGTSLLDFIEQWADERDCEYVALASPVTKERVHHYYERRNYNQWGYVIGRNSDQRASSKSRSESWDAASSSSTLACREL